MTGVQTCALPIDYWLGKQYGYSDLDKGLVDNVIFQSLETYLPIASRQIPTPVVTTDNTAEGIKLSEDVQKMLVHIADIQAMKVKNKQVLRNWALYYLGALQVGWDYIENDISLQVVRSQDLILDPSASYEVNEYLGSYVGRYRSSAASTLVTKFPKMAAVIKAAVSDKMATKIGYIEWWTNDYVFWTMKDIILGKFKNPHWNYTEKVKKTDEFGNEIEEEVKGSNHFKQPKIPFIFLSIFNLGKQPHDETCLIEQSMTLQDTVNKRSRQIDKNADEMNNGWVVNSQFDKEAANNLATALKKGGVIRAPTTDISQSVQRFPGVPLPNFIPEDLFDKRAEIQNIMGVRGSMAQGIMSERTVRGKIEIKGQDVDRISLVTDYLEQFSDAVFNWCLQMMFVYYTEEHTASIIGTDKAVEFISIRNSDLNREFTVSVKEGSMIPQDPLTRRNEAVDLWAQKAIDPISLAERLDVPNPQDYAKRLYQWQTNPQSLFPDLQQPMPQQPQQEAAPQAPPGIPFDMNQQIQ